MDDTKFDKAQIRKVPNTDRKFGASSEYVHLRTENGEDFLFTVNQMRTASRRAKKNPEDVVTTSEVIDRSFFDTLLGSF